MSSVTLVGHSMGGLVANLVSINHRDISPIARDIITLATPHSNPIYAFDKSIDEIHHRLKSEGSNETLVVSFSGGLKDEMINPSVGYVNHKSSMSVSTTCLNGCVQKQWKNQILILKEK